MFAFVQFMAVCPVRSMRAKHGVRGLNRDFSGIFPGLSQRKKTRWARRIQRTQRGFKVYHRILTLSMSYRSASTDSCTSIRNAG